MTDIIIVEVEEEPKEVVLDASVVAKARAKRASRAKPKEETILEEPTEEPKEVLSLPGVYQREPKEEPKSDEKVACSDCGKQMPAKTLKYIRGPNCNGRLQKTKTNESQSYPKGRRPKGPRYKGKLLPRN